MTKALLNLWMGLMPAAILAAVPAFAQEPSRPIGAHAIGKAGMDCADLRYVDFTQTEDAPTQISDARPLTLANGTSYCQIEGYVSRASRFRLRIPLDSWNGKMVVFGTGGQGGELPSNNADEGRASGELRRGFATVQHDGGHFSTLTDALWAYRNEPAQIDFAFRTPHVVTVAAKAILVKATGRAPTRSYFNGCSGGGREAMMMAQRFPYDFDGIVAGAPSMAVRDLILNSYAMSQLLSDQSRTGFDVAAARALHAGVLKQCDKLDGSIDGLIGDPQRCRVDFWPVTCTAGQNEECLTAHQVDIARRIYQGPRDIEGRQIVPSSALPGSELSWVGGAAQRRMNNYPENMLRFSAFDPTPALDWRPDPAELAGYAKRMGVWEALMSPRNPDIREFAGHGGKLLAYYGLTDPSGGIHAVTDYYETVEKVLGGETATQDTFRLFLVPGMNHCGGGEGVSVFDFTDEIDRWVTTGKGPQAITGSKPAQDGKPALTRSIPVYRTK